MGPEHSPPTNPPACPRCRQPGSVDSLTGRCLRCQPIRIDELPLEFQVYAKEGERNRYRQLIVGVLIGPALSLVAAYYYMSLKADTSPQWFLLLLMIIGPLFSGMCIYFFIRKKSLLQRYYRLAQVRERVKPVDAELEYEVWGSRGGSRRCFKLHQLGPGSEWPAGVGKRINVDRPPNSETAAINPQRSLKQVIENYNPFEPQKHWGKVYFDPDGSGSAVICINDGLFLSVGENIRFS